MSPELIQAVLRRGGHRCAWCDCKLDHRARYVYERPCIDYLDGDAANRAPDNTVASCFGCAATRRSEWLAGTRYTIATARALLSESIAGPSTFAVYLDSVRDDLAPGVAFEAALARVETQRWAELEVAA